MMQLYFIKFFTSHSLALKIIAKKSVVLNFDAVYTCITHDLKKKSKLFLPVCFEEKKKDL